MRKLFLDLTDLLVGAVQDSFTERRRARAVQQRTEVQNAYDIGFINGAQQGVEQGIQLGYQLGVQAVVAQCMKPDLPDTPRWDAYRDEESE
jgi:hypothetical protein